MIEAGAETTVTCHPDGRKTTRIDCRPGPQRLVDKTKKRTVTTDLKVVAARNIGTRMRQGHAPQEATNSRSRGSSRTTGSGVSSSGEDDPDPPPSERSCRSCARPLPSDSASQRRYCDDEACKRERCRARKRRQRGTQHRLVTWTDEHGRARSIVDLDLARERHPQDDFGAWCDERATFWLFQDGIPAEHRLALAHVEDRAMLRGRA
jgi:hypothetical protein